MAEEGGAGRVLSLLLHLRPLRAWGFYTRHRGQLLAAGLAFQWVFALFACLWLAFSLTALVSRGNVELQRILLAGVNMFLPGFVGAPDSPVPLDALLEPSVVRLSTVFALLGAAFTAIGFIATLRAAVRTMFDAPDEPERFFRQRLVDLGLVLLFGALLLLGTGLSIVATTASPALLARLGIAAGGLLAHGLTGFIGFLLVALVNVGLVLGILRIVAHLRVYGPELMVMSLCTAALWSLLQTVGLGLLAAPRENPLFSSFAVLFAFFLYLYLLFQLLLYAVAWLAVADRAA